MALVKILFYSSRVYLHGIALSDLVRPIRMTTALGRVFFLYRVEQFLAHF